MKFFDPRSASTFAAGYLWICRDDIPDTAALKADLTRYGEGLEYHLYEETDTHIIVPRHFYAPWLPKHPVYTAKGEPLLRFEDKVTSFRDEEQEQAWEVLRDAKEGVFVLPGGRGKTVLAIKKICHDGVCTTITATLGLLKQWENQLVKFGGIPREDIGWVQGSRVEIGKPILLVSQDTMMLRPHGITPDARDYYGLNIVDECHHMVGARYAHVPPCFRGRRLGLTATPEGSDERERHVKYVMGPMIYRSAYQPLKASLLIKSVPFYKLSAHETRDRRGEFSYPLAWKGLERDKTRNRLILEDVQFYADQGRCIMVMTNRVWHAKLLHEQIKDSGLIIGGVKGDALTDQLSKRIVVATSQKAAEGLDAPALDTLILTMPFGAAGRLKQSFYRILRELKGKANPLVVVYEDPHPPIQALVGKVRKVANEKGYEVRYGTLDTGLVGLHQMQPVRDETEGGSRRWVMPGFPADLGNPPGT